MKIRKDAVVAIDYTLKGDDGEIIDSSEGKEPLYYLHGHKNIVEGLEEALDGCEKGDAFEVSVPPEKGYGKYQEALLMEVPKTELPEDLKVRKGVQLSFNGPAGQQAATIKTVRLKTVVVDANHELADKTLHFSGKVVQVRKASKDELSHGHSHAPGHHHH